MITNSRGAIKKEPRDINKKHPGKTYLPRFLDQSNTENLKASVERELADISMYMEQERQIVDKLVPGSIFKGQWDACSDKYPDPEEENSTWDVIVSCGVTHVFDGKTWEAGHELLYLAVSKIYVQRTNPGTDGIKHQIDEIKVEIGESKAIIQENKLAIAETNLALAEESKKLEAAIGENTSKITITNQVVTDLTQTVATNKTELESKLSGVQTDVDGVKQGVVDANARIDITNQTVANLEGSVATNVTELRAEYKAADTAVANAAAADAQGKADKVAAEAAAALAITNQTVANLEGSLASNVTQLRSEYQAADASLDGKLTGSINKVSADLSVTNQTVANNYQALSSSITNVEANFNGQIAGINQSLTATSNKVGVLESKWTVQADVNGKISGIEMVNNGLKSNFTILTDTFKVTDGSSVTTPFTIEGGRTTMNNAIVRGHLEAASGTFKGRIEADSGYFNGSLNVQAQGGNVGMKITNNQILIYDQNGVLRVKIGQL